MMFDVYNLKLLFPTFCFFFSTGCAQYMKTGAKSAPKFRPRAHKMNHLRVVVTHGGIQRISLNSAMLVTIE